MENKRDTGLYFKLSAKEMELIHQKKALTGIHNTSAYLRKMAIDGYIINLDIKQLNEISRLLRITSNNINQMAKRANETDSIYKTIEKPKQSRSSYSTWIGDEKQPALRESLAELIDRNLEQSLTLEELKTALRKAGCEVKHKAHLAIKLPQGKGLSAVILWERIIRNTNF